jgi:hypothetical protein
MIRINRNHPSIVAWSMCNEVFFSNKAVLPQVRDFLKQLVAYTHQLDPTRPAGIGGAQRGGLDQLGDIAGYNGDGAKLFINPGIPNVVTEYGSVVAVRPGNYSSGFGILAKQPQFPWRSGQVLWCAFDHGSINGREGNTGFVDYFRIPKRMYYWYRNTYANVPPPAWPQPGTPAKLSLTADKTTIHGTDATDDVQLLVTVQDKDGHPISNSPPVTFTIESGPGEFPTGRSITFAPDSDIAIRDGQAAIEFRSYYGGPSVIRATSPGLQDGLITITTEGTPVFIPGQTPVVADRPYVRYTRKNAASSPADQNIALNHPASASSETPGHTAGLAIDGNTSTAWQAADNQPGAWWQTDLENFYSLTSVHTTFPAPGNYRYKIEGSSDGSTWTVLADDTQSTATDQTRTDILAPNSHLHNLRLTFIALPPNQPAAIAEIKMYGQVSP